MKVLKELNLQQYQPIFYSKNIDGKQLAAMTEDDLRLLGVSAAHQGKILNVINGHVSAQLLITS